MKLCNCKLWSSSVELLSFSSSTRFFSMEYSFNGAWQKMYCIQMSIDSLYNTYIRNKAHIHQKQHDQCNPYFVDFSYAQMYMCLFLVCRYQFSSHMFGKCSSFQNVHTLLFPYFEFELTAFRLLIKIFFVLDWKKSCSYYDFDLHLYSKFCFTAAVETIPYLGSIYELAIKARVIVVTTQIARLKWETNKIQKNWIK